MSAPLIKKKGPPPVDAVYLLFEVQLAPGESAEVRPSSAFRCKLPPPGGSSPFLEVPLASVSPFKTMHIGPRKSPAESTKSRASWEQSTGIWFKSTRFSGEADWMVQGETPAWLVSHWDVFPTSQKATDISFVVENRSDKPVRFTGWIDGKTLSDQRHV